MPSLRGPYRRWLVARVLLAETVVLALVFAISAATDEGNVTFFVRLGRVIPLVPLAAAVAVYAVMAGVRKRGEARALESLGVSPRTLSLVCVLAASVLPGLAALSLGSGNVDVRGYFPPPPAAPEIRVVESGFVSADLGVAVTTEGVLSAYVEPANTLHAPPRANLPTHARAAAGLTTLLVGVALSLTSARARRRLVDLVPPLACAAAVLVSFQLAAAGLGSAFLATVPAMALLALELRAYRRAT